MIETTHLTKRFNHKTAVDHLNLKVQPGEIFAFLGPNGAGKTTTIKMLVGLLRPTEGQISICGHPIGKDDLKAKASIAYVPDQPYLYDKLTGREFLDFVGRMYAMPVSDIRREIDRLRELFELSDYIDDLTENYSHGMKQRVVFSAALMHHPEVLIIDEPMVGLDPKSVRLVKDILREEARKGVTVFMSTHTLEVAEVTATRLGIIQHGKMIAEGELSQLREGIGDDARLEDIFLQITEQRGANGE